MEGRIEGNGGSNANTSEWLPGAPRAADPCCYLRAAPGMTAPGGALPLNSPCSNTRANFQSLILLLTPLAEPRILLRSILPNFRMQFTLIDTSLPHHHMAHFSIVEATPVSSLVYYRAEIVIKCIQRPGFTHSLLFICWVCAKLNFLTH